MTDTSRRDPIDELAEAFAAEVRHGQRPSIDDYVDRHPELADEIRDLFPLILEFEQAKSVGDLTNASVAALPTPEERPQQVGRYRIVRLLGAGGFGRVYLGRDDDLQRDVAIKVPHARGNRRGVLRNFIREAKIVARIDHPHIVPVYDVGETDDGTHFIVSRFISGQCLVDRMLQERLRLSEAVRIAAEIAEALHAAHCEDLVHRDVKPANILLDERQRAFITDFGIALWTDDISLDLGNAGTPRYMSPEQAEKKRRPIDLRSDVYSLGVVLYEMLTGDTPYRAESTRDLLDRIVTQTPRPPAQVNPRVPPELEEVCLTAMSRQRSDRYATAAEMANALRRVEKRRKRRSSSNSRWASLRASRRHAVDLVPSRDLEPFDRNEESAFLKLAPGPLDSRGIPESIRFWRHRITHQDGLPIGLLYGEAGSGKTSLVHAGILPQLPAEFDVVCPDPTPDLVATSLQVKLSQLLDPQARSDHAPHQLVQQLAARPTKRGRRRRLLVVLDQFERFLADANASQRAELTEVLRKSDGVHTQFLAVARTRAWLTATRFVNQVGVTLHDGKSSRMLERLNIRHACNVLERWGRAAGALPPAGTELSREQSSFVERSVAVIAAEGGVVPWWLALFFKSLLDRPWNSTTLDELRGMASLGATYLDDGIQESKLSENRIRQVRAVLREFVDANGHDPTVSRESIQACCESRADVQPIVDLLTLRHKIIELDLTAITDSVPAPYCLTHPQIADWIRCWLDDQDPTNSTGRALPGRSPWQRAADGIHRWWSRRP